MSTSSLQEPVAHLQAVLYASAQHCHKLASGMLVQLSEA